MCVQLDGATYLTMRSSQHCDQLGGMIDLKAWQTWRLGFLGIMSALEAQPTLHCGRLDDVADLAFGCPDGIWPTWQCNCLNSVVELMMWIEYNVILTVWLSLQHGQFHDLVILTTRLTYRHDHLDNVATWSSWHGWLEKWSLISWESWLDLAHFLNVVAPKN